MFRTINYILTSPNSRIKVPYIRSLHVEMHCAIIEYENVKGKPAHYLIQIVDLYDPNDQQYE